MFLRCSIPVSSLAWSTKSPTYLRIQLFLEHHHTGQVVPLHASWTFNHFISTRQEQKISIPLMHAVNTNSSSFHLLHWKHGQKFLFTEGFLINAFSFHSALNTQWPGCTPLAKAVAKATANKPQSFIPSCCWTLIILILISFSGHAKRAATCYPPWPPKECNLLS